MGRKLRAALLVEGELPQEGLATQELDDGDLMLTLAKRLAAGERAESQALETLFAESRALEAGTGETLNGAAWEDRADHNRGEDLHSPQITATTAIAAPARQLALLALSPVPPPQRSDLATAPNDAESAGVSASMPHTNTTPPAEPESTFIPSAGKVVPLPGWLGLTASPAPPRRRKQPARDQLKLFG